MFSRRLKDDETSDKILFWKAAIKRVIIGQLLSKYYIFGPLWTCKLSFVSIIIMYRLFSLSKTDAENYNIINFILARVCIMTVVCFIFVVGLHGASVRRATYLCLDYTKNVDKLE